jgi:tight adherence protein B
MTTATLMIIVFICTFLFVYAFCGVLYSMFGSENARMQKRLDALLQSQNKSFQQEAGKLLKDRKNEEPFISNIPALMQLPLLFVQAGMKVSVKQWCIVTAIFGFVAMVGTWIVTANVLFAVAAFFGAVMMRYWMVLQKRNNRVKQFEANLAQSLDVLSRSLRAGHPLPMGMQMVSKEMPAPIGTEFGQVFHEQQMGLPIEESLKEMAVRVPLMDLRFFVLTVLIHRQTGGDLSEVLDNLSNVIRDRFKVLGQVKALTAEGRLSGWVLGVLPFFVFFIIQFINPGYTKILFEHELGQKMVYTSLFFEIMGVLLIKKIVDIKV